MNGIIWWIIVILNILQSPRNQSNSAQINFVYQSDPKCEMQKIWNLMNIFKIRSTYLSRLFSSQSVIDLSYKYIKDCIMRIVQLNYSFPSSAFEAFELRFFFFIVGPGRALRTCDHKALSRSPSNVQLKLISHVRSTQAIVFCTNHTFWIFVDCICERSRPNEHRILFHRNIDFLLCVFHYINREYWWKFGGWLFFAEAFLFTMINN